MGKEQNLSVAELLIQYNTVFLYIDLFFLINSNCLLEKQGHLESYFTKRKGFTFPINLKIMCSGFYNLRFLSRLFWLYANVLCEIQRQ